jgi:carbamoyl-phosphate synthase/aspartate carbamoyltransferase/dihydroorotase
VEVDPDVCWEVHAADFYTRCGWTPFEGWQMRGRVRQVTLRDQVVYQDGQVLAQPGFGQNFRQS